MCYLNDFNNTNTLFQLTIEKMDNVQKNRISNIKYRYGIEKNSENFNKLAMVMNQKECVIYKKFLTLLENVEQLQKIHIVQQLKFVRKNTDIYQKIYRKKNFIKIIKKRKVNFDTNLFFTIISYK